MFIPVIVEELRTKSREEAWEAVSGLVVTAMAVLWASACSPSSPRRGSSACSPSGWRAREAAQQQELATFFLRVFAPQIVLYGYAAIAAGLLNAHDRFAVPDVRPRSSTTWS